MTYSKTIVCLANSSRPRGRCVAGKETLHAGFGGWIRPVSPRSSPEISTEERQYQSGSEPSILDVIDVPMIGPAPRLHQTENHMIDSDWYWTKLGEFSKKNLAALSDAPPALWGNGDSSRHGKNDRMTESIASQFTNSLWLIQPRHVKIRVLTVDSRSHQRKRVRAKFVYRDMQYDFIVTDPTIEDLFLKEPDAQYTVGASYFCVGVTEAHTDGFCYKLVPTIIPVRKE